MLISHKKMMCPSFSKEKQVSFWVKVASALNILSCSLFSARGNPFGGQNQGYVFQKNQCPKKKGAVDSLRQDDNRVQIAWKYLWAYMAVGISWNFCC